MEAEPRRALARLTAVAAYLVLLVLGALEGTIGSFEFSVRVAGMPAVLALVLVTGGTCLLAGLGMGTAKGGLVVGVGWFGATFLLAMQTSGGSVIITNTAAGDWYLLGGLLCVAAGIAGAAAWLRRSGGAREPANRDEAEAG